MKKKKVFLFLMLVIVLLILIFLFFKNEKNVLMFLDKEEQSNVSQTVENEVEKVEITYQQHVIFEKKFSFNVKIENFNTSNNYKVIFKVNDQNYGEKTITKNDESISIDNLMNIVEGENSIEIQYFVNEQNIGTSSFSIFYVEPYTKQFLDEFSNVGFSTHFGYMYNRDNEKDIQLLKNMGCYNVRDDIRFNLIDRLEWVDKLYENDIKLYGILLPQPRYGLGEGNDWAVNNEEEFEEYSNNMSILASKIDDKVYKYEMSNEPNWFIYTKENIKWYSKQTEKTMEIVGESKETDDFVIGSTCANGAADKRISSIEFLREVENNNLYKHNMGISFHSYDLKHSLDFKHQELIEQHLDFINDYGGFQHLYISEYGMDTSYDGESEDFQAKLLVRQSVYNDMYGIKNSYIYSFRDMGFDKDDPEHYYGVITYDRKPKKAYYAVKKYFENINGAEYIGIVNIVDGIIAHVYDKDGKVKIVAWTEEEDSTANIDYSGFTAKNIYGNQIENTNGILTISDEPVYLDNISNKYFYEAISNIVLDKYEEFEEKFATELASIDGIDAKIEELKQYMSSISEKTSEAQDTAIQKMSNHFALGSIILNAYKNGKLNVEYVKLSSMLDMLNDIGNSYEDLLTVCATNNEPYFTATEELIQKVENTINNNSDLEIVYPSKILDFSKELAEKAKYINSLEEKNDIKTGLIVSNSLHAYYLADWANEFAQIYVEDYIKANPITVSYSNTDEFTNQDVVATLNIGSDSKVTNNGGKNTYTFTQNGEFTFEYKRRGQAYKIKTTVNSIDKQAPTISGVENGKIYYDTVTLSITDTNLANVEVLFNEEKLEYTNGMEFDAEGIYNVTVTDKAGNTSKVQFYIIEDSVDGYVVRDNYLLNVKQKTTVKDFAEKFTLQTSYKILRDRMVLTDNTIIGTGDILQLENGTEYTIIVAGDINGDGRVANYDLSALRRYILRIRDFSEIESLAADINIDGNSLGVKDYSRMKIEILGRY